MRRGRVALWRAIAVGLVVALFIGVLATRNSAANEQANSPLLDKPVPDFASTATDGSPFTLSSLQGKWVLVNFFATWCVPCREEQPDLVAFQDAHRAAGDAQVVGVVYSDSEAVVRDFRATHGGDWPYVSDPNGRIAIDFGVSGVPESFLVSPDGVVVSKIVGGVRRAALEQLLTEAARKRR